MPIVSFARHIAETARRFASAKGGNVAILFTFALLPLLAFVGAAIDYSRAAKARTSLQAALDSAALMLSRDLSQGTITASDIPTKADGYVKGLFTDNKDAALNGNVTATYTLPSGGSTPTIQLAMSGQIQTDFMRLAGFPNMNFNATSTATWGNTRMRVAMVLDNTGSMAQNGKMAALQSAAKSMIDTLSGYNTQTGDVYISIVPFAKDVNVGTDSSGASNVNAPWINWTDWEAEPKILTDNSYPINVTYNSIAYTWADIGPGAPCPFDTTNKGSPRPTNNSSVGKFGFACMDRPATVISPVPSDLSTLSTNRYLIPSSGTYAGMICPGIDSGTHYPGKTSVYYNGCYTSVVDHTTVVSGPSSSASCGSNPNCACSGSGSSKKCTRTYYKHYWRTHPTDPVQAANAAPAHTTWTGCVNDRDQDYDTKNTAPGNSSAAPSTQFYAEQWSGCLPATVFAMSNQWSTLKNQITAMTPSGNTNQAVGLAWGWQSLSTTNGPISAPPKDSNYVYKDYIVLLSDGLNTQNRWSTTQSSIDARQEILCSNVQHDTMNPVTIFTIQVNINNADPKSQVLQDCATNGNFQMITSSSQTADAFQNIITQISKLRVAK
jgi:Flp pilus assembly protein TadG